MKTPLQGVNFTDNQPVKTKQSKTFNTPLTRFITALLVLFIFQAYGQTSQTFTSNGTYTVPAGVTQLVVECWGGGGAGGGATGNPAAGGGGGGGAYVKSTVNVTPGTTYTVTVGGIKTATTTSSAATNKGNPSWFGSTSTIFAEGGNGGAPATSNNSNGAGGTGTTAASIGTLRYAGGNAAAGNFNNNTLGGAGGGGAGSTGVGGNAAAGVGGTGTTLNGGNGANGVANSTPGAAGASYGGGGSGGKARNNTDRAGGSGAGGLVIVTIPTPANDNCSAATALTLGGSAVTGDINMATTSLAACTGADAYDVWYSFTTTCSGNHTITVDPSNSFNAVVQLYNACGGTVVTPNSGGSCVNAGGDNVNETPTYNLASGTTYYVRVYDYNLTAAGYPATTTFTIAVSTPPLPTTAAAGPDQTGSATCGATALTLGANNPSSGTGSWSIVSGTGGSFVNASSFNSTFNGTLGSTYTLRWTISTSGCTPSTDDVTVAFNLNPTANAGPDQTSSATCGLTTVTLAASMNAGTGTWSIISGTGGSFSNTSSPTSTFTGAAGSTYTLRWTVTNSPCTQTATDDVVITFNRNPVLVISTPAAVCSNTPGGVNLTASAVTAGSTGGGTLSYWTNALATNALSSPSAVTTSGTYYIRSLTSAGCVDIEPVTVTITPLPVATFSYTQSPICKNGSNPLPTFSGGGAAGTFSSTAGLSFVSTATGQVNLSSSTANTYTVTNTRAAAGGCAAVTATSTITITNPPTATIAYSGNPFCRSVTTAAVTRTGSTGGTYSASPAGLTIDASTGTITPSTSTAGTYTVTYTVAASGGCAIFTTTASVTINALPVVSIATNYCNPGAGLVRLTATAGLSYVWNTGATSQVYDADEAGTYTVTATNSNGCVSTATVNVATELVTNGNFSAGNTGFTSPYFYQSAFDLYPEGYYSVGTNANSYHGNFFGTDHTTGTGNFMIINGSGAPIPPVVWQQTVTVQPNTTYYFSAWTMSVNNVPPFAKLRFAVNDVQVGTIASPGAGPTSNAGPFNWVRFYGTWTSGPTATTAEISILDVETALGGNDFGLDDISFGTLSPMPFTVAPGAGVGGNTICEGSPLTIYANRDGGMSPFTYSWTGPNGFTSNAENPFISASATAAMAGTYNLSVTDGQTCTASGSFVLTVNPLPNNLTPTAVPASVCSAVSSNIQIASSQVGVSYQLRNNTNNDLVGVAVAGTGGTINLPTGSISATTTFNVLATNTTTGCSRQLSTTPTVTLLPTPVLVITNQASCTGTVNLTAAGVTAGSTGGGTLTYWTNAACTTAVSNPSSVTTGTYYIRSAVGSCVDIEPVVVSVGTLPVATFNYTGSPFCSSSADPLPTFSGGGVAGVFSSTTGAVFVSTSTGQIDLSATPAGTHTITNTITPLGACSPVSVSRTIVVTAHPSATFSYGATTFCQNANAADPLPVFSPGASAGTFSSSFGLTFTNASTGQIDISASTPGSYAVRNSKAAAGGCPAVSATSFIYINPYTFSGGVVTTVAPTTICGGQTINLTSEAAIYLSAVFREDFNSLSNNWVTTNSSTGGTPANAAFTLQPDGYNYGGQIYSNDGSQFYFTNSQAQGSGGTTATTLRSPAISTIGYSSLALDFFHYYDYRNSGDAAKVQVSVDGFNWIDVATYTADVGNRDDFQNAVINLDDYVGLSSMFIRFKFDATNDRYWAIDNVSLTGYSTNYNYSWASSPSGFISALQNPTSTPTVNTSYTATATNSYGCSAASSANSVTVNPSPMLSSTLTPPAICSNTAFTYTPTSATSGVTYSWTRAAVAGISNAAVTTPQSANPNETLINTTTSPIDVVYRYVTAKNGCSTTQNVTVRVNAPNVWNGSQSTNWFTGLNWCINGTGIPTSTSTALIPSVTVTGRNPIIDNAQGTNAVTKNLQILSGGGLTINGNAALTVWGTWNNSGTFTANSSTVTFKGNVIDSINGTDVQQFYNLTLDKGTDTTSVLKANVDVNIANTLALTNGLYNQNEGGGNITNALTISNKSGIDVTNNATLTTSAGVTNSGLLRVTNGTISIGGSSAHNLLINAGGRLRVTTGRLTVAGNITNTSSTSRINGGTVEAGASYSAIGTSSLIQTAGTITLNMNMASNNSDAVFDISGTSNLNLTGGNIILQDGNGGEEVEIESGAGTKTISASHNFQLGNDLTLSSSTFEMEIGSTKLGKLTVYNADALVAKLNTNITVSALVLNSVIDLNSYRLIIDNPSVNAITGNSYIKSETANGNSKLQWNIGNSTGNYVFPFGNDMGTAIPFTFNITTAGSQTTAGNITVATYPTADNNTPLVNGVSHMNMENGGNGPMATLDRWWIIDANNYATKPISNMTFKYADVDLIGNTLLSENGLKAQRWDVSLNNSLGGWNPPDYFGVNTVNPSNNTVTINDVTNYSPWVLHDGSSSGNSPLPIELLDFTANCNGDVVTINWITATEQNNDYFTIQRSEDLVVFNDIAVVEGAGNSNAPLTYTANDEFPISGKNVYYRLMQTDYNGDFEIFKPVATMCIAKNNDIITVYPNPATDVVNVRMDIGADDKGVISIYNGFGQVVKQQIIEPTQGQNIYSLQLSDLSSGQYFVSFSMDNKNYPVQKLMVTR